MLLNDTWWNCEGHMMDVGMYVDSLHNTHSRAFVSGNKVMFCMVYPHRYVNIVWILVLLSQTLTRESGYA